MGNINLLETTNNDIRILIDIIKALNESLSLEDIYKIALDKASQIEKVDMIMIYIVDSNRKIAELQAYKNVPEQYLNKASQIPYPRGLTWKIIESGEILNNDDLQNETSLGKAGRELGPKSVLAIPVRQKDRTIGVLFFISYEERKFSQREFEILSAIGDQLSIAISNATQNEEIMVKDRDLKISRKQHMGLFENVPVGLCRTGPSGEIVLANQTFVEMLGYSSFDQLVNSNSRIQDFYAEKKEKGLEDIFRNSDKIRNIESVLICKDGSPINIIQNKHAVRGENGAIFYIENTIQDITLQKSTEKALKDTISELIKKNKYEKIISAITKSLSETMELDDVLENTAELIRQNVEGVNYLSVYIVEGRVAVLKASRGYPEWLVDRIKRIPYPSGNIWKTIKQKKIRYSKELTDEYSLFDLPDTTGTRCFVSIPVFKDDTVTGCINISSIEKDKFDSDEINLLKVISQQIGISITNTSYVEGLKYSTKALHQSEEKFRNTFENAAVGIALVNIDGQLLRVNEKFCNIVGYNKSELLNMSFHDITHQEDLDNDIEYLEKLRCGAINNYSVEKRFFHKNAHLVWIKLTVSVQRNSNETEYYIGIIEDISERKKYEKRLEESLVEKEVLIKEIHHRVKNNLQIISSLIHLQSRKMDKCSSYGFREMYDRIRIMALTHEKLYQSDNLAVINFQNFIRSLVDNLVSSHKVNTDKLEIIQDTSDINFGINIAIPCGLIINEILTNSFKYAFPSGESGGKIRIELSMFKECDAMKLYRLKIEDNGVGLPDEFDLYKCETLGMQIVLDLVEQINGRMTVEGNGGTSFEIVFPEI